MIDFSKIGTGSTADTVLPPREIFNALPNKSPKFQYPRDVQSQVWGKWFERRNDRSIVIKMNTGSGKTVVGLTILKSCLNEGKFPAVYICPDNYLVEQVTDAAKELGIEVTTDPHDYRFRSGKSILVTNVYKLVNGRSTFGVGDEGVKLAISSLLIDDAHACIETVEEQFSLKLPSNTGAYAELWASFRQSLTKQCETKTAEIEAGDPTSYLEVPYWTWQDQLANTASTLVNHRLAKELEYTWPLLKEDLTLCNCVVSANCIEISPHAIPIHMIPCIPNADRQIFMTATLVDDSILASHFGVANHLLEKAIVPDSAGDIGDRMILFPQALNTETTEHDIKGYCKWFSTYRNVVVIVPSRARASFWEDIADRVIDKTNIYREVEKLKSTPNGLTVMINRYDGVDLPGEACRLLVIDAFPDVRRLIEKVKQGILIDSHSSSGQLLQRIEQGMGRGIRSNDDYCIVFLVGKDLTSKLYSKGAVNKLSPGTKAQLQLSEQVAEQIRGTQLTDITDTLNYCLGRDQNWMTASKGVLATLKYPEKNIPDNATVKLREAYDHASNKQIEKAVQVIQTLVNEQSDQNIKGYYKQKLAEYTNLQDKVSAQQLQLSAVSDNRRLLKPFDGVSYSKLNSLAHDQATACSNYLNQHYSDSNNLIIDIEGLLSDLQFAHSSASKFEEAIKQLTNFIGFTGQRPELEYGKGPDNLWSMGNLTYAVIECKNETVTQFINKKDCNQLNGSCNWFEAKYDNTCMYTPIMIHCSAIFEYAASPHPRTRIMCEEDLERLKDAVARFIRSLATNNSITPQIVNEKLRAHKLLSTDLIPSFTQSFRIKNHP